MEELTLKIGLFHHEFNDEVDVLQSWKCREFSENTGKSLIIGLDQEWEDVAVDYQDSSLRRDDTVHQEPTII